MAEDVLIRCPSSPLAKAFPKNVQQDKYRDIYLVSRRPSGDGVFNAGQDGSFTASRIFLSPYCEGEPGGVFWMRLYGWRSIGEKVAGSTNTVWMYYVLAEFLCVAGWIPGPIESQTQRPGSAGFGLPLGPTENLCQTLALTAGVLGATGFVNSMPPGYNMPASAAVELAGVQLVSFDFYQAQDSHLAANCLFSMI